MKNIAPIWCDEIRKVIKGKNPEDAITMAQLRIKSIYRRAVSRSCDDLTEEE